MTTPQFRDEYDVGFDAGRKSVHDACVDAWKADYYKAAFAAGAASRDAEVEALKRELREGDDLRERLSDILTRSVNAIRGEPEPLSLHSWHDLPELIEALRVDAARINYLNKNKEKNVFSIVSSWYTRPGYGQPYKKRKSLREAIDAAIAAEETK